MRTYLFIYYFDKAKQFAKWVKDRPKVRTHMHTCIQTWELANNRTLQAYSQCGVSGNLGEDREGTYVHIGWSAKQEMGLLGKKKELWLKLLDSGIKYKKRMHFIMNVTKFLVSHLENAMIGPNLNCNFLNSLSTCPVGWVMAVCSKRNLLKIWNTMSLSCP